MEKDIFCKIINKEHDADIVAESDLWLAVKDIRPQAPHHILIFPKKHISGISDLGEEDVKLVGTLLLGAKEVAEKVGLDKGYRIIINQGDDGGQAISHLHVHILGGKHLGPKIVH